MEKLEVLHIPVDINIFYYCESFYDNSSEKSRSQDGFEVTNASVRNKEKLHGSFITDFLDNKRAQNSCLIIADISENCTTDCYLIVLLL